jgi:hypothetical protein
VCIIFKAPSLLRVCVHNIPFEKVAATSWRALSASQQPISPPLDPYPTKPRLTFNAATGTFNITVFSDMHYGENPWDVWGPEQDKNSTIMMKKVLKDKRPDYV